MTKEALIAAGLTPQMLKQIGLALEQGMDEDEQRECHGDTLIDWIQETHGHLSFDAEWQPSWKTMEQLQKEDRA